MMIENYLDVPTILWISVMVVFVVVIIALVVVWKRVKKLRAINPPMDQKDTKEK
jgi:hypothetical protein